MQLRGRDVEQWMSHRRLPEDLRRYKLKLIFEIILMSSREDVTVGSPFYYGHLSQKKK